MYCFCHSSKTQKARSIWLLSSRHDSRYFRFFVFKDCSIQKSSFHKVTAFLFITYIPYHQWNTCLLTESLFCSSILISLYFLHQKREKIFLIILITICAALLRPNGFLVVVTLMIWWFFNSKIQKRYKFLFLFLCLLSLTFTIEHHTKEFYLFISDALKTGDYICGYPFSI